MPRLLALWLVFTLIACGLGYAAVTRYDPTLTGNSDAILYFAMIDRSATLEQCDHRCLRVLVPTMARAVAAPFAGLPPMAALLAVSAAFSAATALLLARLTRSLGGSSLAAAVAPLLYLVQFPVVHAHLAGLVDAGEVFFVVVATVALIERRLVLLIATAVLGSLSRETYPIILAALVAAFVAAGSPTRFRVGAIGAVALAGATLIVLHVSSAGTIVLPPHLQYALPLSQWPAGLWRCISSREMLYAFVWLLPLGAWGARALPRAWIAGAALGALAMLGLAAIIDAHGNAARAMFDAAGPLLTVGAARWVASRYESAA